MRRVGAPAVDLLVRLSLAKVVFAPGMLPSTHLFAFAQAAWPTIIVQVAGPMLLAVGLWVRPVAVLMLGLTLLAQISLPPQDEHLFWAALFGWYVVQGAGTLSLDHLLGKGLGLGPLHLAGLAMAAAGWLERESSRSTGSRYACGWRPRSRRTDAGACDAAVHAPADAAAMPWRCHASVCRPLGRC